MTTLFATAFVLVAAEGAPARLEGSLEARLGEQVTLYAAVRRGRVWYTDAPRVRGVARSRVRPLADLQPASVQWLLVEPRMHHVETRPPNFPNPAYSNSVLFGRDHGRWLGYDTLEYSEQPIPHVGTSLVVTRANPSHPGLRVNGGLGTMRYKVRITVPDEVLESAGAERVGRGGISPRVPRVSFRSGDDLVGYLTSYFNVPNVFGSAGRGRAHQTDRHQGADCADVIIGAARKAGAPIPYTSVAGLHRFTRDLTGTLRVTPEGLRDEDGEAVLLTFGEGARRGDLVLIKYGVDFTGRRWDHVAVLTEDRGQPGVFDPSDQVMHMGFLSGLVREPLAAQNPAIIRLVRFDRRYARRLGG